MPSFVLRFGGTKFYITFLYICHHFYLYLYDKSYLTYYILWDIKIHILFKSRDHSNEDSWKMSMLIGKQRMWAAYTDLPEVEHLSVVCTVGKTIESSKERIGGESPWNDFWEDQRLKAHLTPGIVDVLKRGTYKYFRIYLKRIRKLRKLTKYYVSC